MGVGAGGGEADSGGACAKANSLSHAVGGSGCHCRLHGPPPPFQSCRPREPAQRRGESQSLEVGEALPQHTHSPLGKGLKAPILCSKGPNPLW